MSRTLSFFAALLLTIGTFMALAPVAEAKWGDSRPPRRGGGESWVCYAQGQRSLGYPHGSIWETSTGRGRDQQDAMWRALNSCQSWGLHFCNIQHCFRN